MKTKTLTLCALLAGLVATSTSLVAANSSHEVHVAKDSSIKGHDKTFFEKAAKSGEKELIVSRAVLPNLSNPEVKAFAESMITDHTAANAGLKSLATSKGVTLPVLESKVGEKWVEKTKNADENYLEEMISDHKDAVELFEKASKSEDPEIAAFASTTLPKLQHHLATAKALKKSH
jgi:putative membrane protein